MKGDRKADEENLFPRPQKTKPPIEFQQMNNWHELASMDKNEFMFTTIADLGAHELTCKRQKDGSWKCELHYFDEKALESTTPIRGEMIAVFIADFPQHAIKVADEIISRGRQNPKPSTRVEASSSVPPQ